ncbi:MAG: RNA polymerase sigma factor [Planctomycetota bacterium]|jgi:RNA polymerase sigma-70 factor (ECF subfamily)
MVGTPLRAASHRDSAATRTKTIDDRQLLSHARDGDRAAFGVLVDRHHRTLAAVIVQRFGYRAPVEDLVQEVFARTLQHLPRFEGRSSFLTWACSIALNLGTDWQRKEARRRRLAPMESLPAEDVAPSPDRGPGAVAAQRDEVVRARAALDKLPEPQRLAVTLRVVETRDYGEIAERLDIEPGLARTWVSRGLKRLREMLREEQA